jgi:hypothetical protein
MSALLMTVGALPAAAQMTPCDTSHYRAGDGLSAEASAQSVRITWNGDPGQQVRMQLAVRNGTPTIEDLSLRPDGGAWTPLASGAVPDFAVTTGLRRISNDQLAALRAAKISIDKETVDRNRWDPFSDDPLDTSDTVTADSPPKEGIPEADQPGLPRSRSEIQHASVAYHIAGCSIRSDGARLIIDLPGLDLGVFNGLLRFTVFRGTNLISQQVVAKTAKPWVAYKFDAGLKGIPITEASRVAWRDTAGAWQDYKFHGDVDTRPVALRAANRLAAVELGGGALAVLPPPHKFWPRNSATIMGFNYYRKDSASSYSYGVMQNDHDEILTLVPQFGSNWTLYNARPGTEQLMTVFLYPTLGKADEAIDHALRFTRGDHFKPMPGFQVMNHHYHMYVGERLQREGSANTKLQDFAALKAVGINIVSPVQDEVLSTYAGAGGPKVPGDQQERLKLQAEGNQQRLAITRIFAAGAKANSDDSFMIMLAQEIFGSPLGGHVDLLFSHPVYWDERLPGQPAEESDPTYGRVYHVGSADDLMRMVEQENAIVSLAHPRTKGSAGYPDAIKDRDYFNNPRYFGFGARWGMGIDGSERELCQYRCWPLLDDMSNWLAAKNLPLKKIVAISEAFYSLPGDDIYGNAPVTYLRLAKLPPPGDASAVIETLRNGYSFWTTGEVLAPSFELRGTGRNSTIIADVEWTFPLQFVEVVWGDGQTTGRQIISATDLPPFGSRRFEIPFDTRGKKWVRFAAWDCAADGAVLQPVAIPR